MSARETRTKSRGQVSAAPGEGRSWAPLLGPAVTSSQPLGSARGSSPTVPAAGAVC